MALSAAGPEGGLWLDQVPEDLLPRRGVVGGVVAIGILGSLRRRLPRTRLLLGPAEARQALRLWTFLRDLFHCL